MRRIYIDGIWDCFHMGHVLHFKKIKYLDNQENFLIVGIVNDKDATSYKREPIYNETNRKILVESCKYVNKVIVNSPLTIDKKFIKENKIDLVAHAFSNNKDLEKQESYFKVAKELGIFRRVKYNKGISTTQIINKIKNNY